MDRKYSLPYRLTFNYRRGKVNVYRSVLDGLNRPKFIYFVHDRGNKILGIVGTDSRHKSCFDVSLFTANKRGNLEFSGTDFVGKFSDLIGWSKEGHHTVEGVLDEEHRAIFFDLTKEVIDGEDEDDEEPA